VSTLPAVSQKQRSFLFATKGPAWVARHHFDNPGPLPVYVKKKTGTQRLAERLAERRR